MPVSECSTLDARSPCFTGGGRTGPSSAVRETVAIREMEDLLRNPSKQSCGVARTHARSTVVFRWRSFQVFSRLAGLDQANRSLLFHARSNTNSQFSLGRQIYNGSYMRSAPPQPYRLFHHRHGRFFIACGARPGGRSNGYIFPMCHVPSRSPEGEALREIVKVCSRLGYVRRGDQGGGSYCSGYVAKDSRRRAVRAELPQTELSGWPILS